MCIIPSIPKVDLIAEQLTKYWKAGSTYSVDALDKVMISDLVIELITLLGMACSFKLKSDF